MLEVGPQDHLHIWWFPRKNHRTQHLVLLTAMTHYDERRQSKIRKEKGAWCKGNQVWASKNSPPRGVTKGLLKSPSKRLWHHVKCCQTRKLIRDWVPKVSIDGWSYSHPLPSKSQNSRLSDGKWVFNVYHIVFTKLLGTVSHFYQKIMGIFWNPSCQIPARAKLLSKPF